jgi:hypothetical protein
MLSLAISMGKRPENSGRATRPCVVRKRLKKVDLHDPRLLNGRISKANRLGLLTFLLEK